MGDVIGDLNSRRGMVGEFVDKVCLLHCPLCLSSQNKLSVTAKHFSSSASFIKVDELVVVETNFPVLNSVS